jgi:hypothetical protein
MTDTTTTAAAPAVAAPTSAAAALATPPAAPAGDTTTAAPAAAPAVPAAPTEPGLSLPGKDATPEQWSEFYGKIGRPEKAEEYGLAVREGEDPAFVGEVASVMHKYGLTKEQAVGLQKDLMTKADERLTAAEQAKTAALDAKNQAEQTELKTELGERYDAQMELGKRAVRQFAGEQAADIIGAMEEKIGYKATLKFFMGLGAGLGEHDANGRAEARPEGERPSTASVLYGSNKS